MKRMVLLAAIPMLFCCNHPRGWLDTTKASLYTASEAASTVWNGTRTAMDERCTTIAESCGKEGNLGCPQLIECKHLHATLGTVVATVYTAIGSAMVALSAVEAAMAKCEGVATVSEKSSCMDDVSDRRLRAIQLTASALSAIEGLRARIAKEGLSWK